MIATFFAATQTAASLLRGPQEYLPEWERGYRGAKFATRVSEQILHQAERDYQDAVRRGNTEQADRIYGYLKEARPVVESRKIMLGMAPQRPEPKAPDYSEVQSYLNFQAAKAFNDQLREETSAPIKNGLQPVSVRYQASWTGLLLLGGIIWFVFGRG